jgi:putative N6-adenine-specific DNA methylase
LYEYQIRSQYFAQTASSLSQLAGKELKSLGAKNVNVAYRGVVFESSKADLYKMNYTSRLITRTLAPIIKFGCHSTKYLYNRAKTDIDWSDFLSPEESFAIFANVSDSNITHSHYALLRLKDAIVDQFREKFGKRPDIEKIDPSVWFNLHIHKNFAQISVDTSGGSLHRRGYRQKSVEAPMQETVAAAIIELSGWNGKTPIYDPMCGSGTLLSEALMRYCKIPAGFLRETYGFQSLPDYDAKKWNRIKDIAERQMRSLPEGLIAGSDISSEAISAANTNLNTLPHGKTVTLKRIDFRDIKNLDKTLIVCNPPYGVRLGDHKEVIKLYQDFGNFLKQKCNDTEAYIYFGIPKLIKHIGLTPTWEKELKNGGLRGKLVKFKV